MSSALLSQPSQHPINHEISTFLEDSISIQGGKGSIGFMKDKVKLRTVLSQVKYCVVLEGKVIKILLYSHC